MATWQYKLFIVPEEEINSYFEKNSFIGRKDLNEIDWWKYHKLDHNAFDFFKDLLTEKKSWSDDIILFGDESSNCIEILRDAGNIIEISARIDLRYDYKQLINILCEFAQKYGFIFLNAELKIISPKTQLVEQDIANFAMYKSFLNRFR